MIVLNVLMIVLIFFIGLYNRYTSMSQLHDLGNATLQSFRAIRPLIWTQAGVDSPVMKGFMDLLAEQSTLLNLFMFTADGEIIYAYQQPDKQLITDNSKPRMVHGNRLVLYDKFTPDNMHGRMGNESRMTRGMHHPFYNKEIISCIVLDASKTVKARQLNIAGLILAVFIQAVLVLVFIRFKQQLAAYEESEKRLRVAEQDAATGHLANVLAHEIKNPLSSMKGLISYALKKVDDNKSKESLEKSIDEVDRLAGIVNGFLTFGRQVDLNIKTISLYDVIDRAIALLSYDIDEHNASIIKTGGDFAIQADPDKLLQVMVNLIMNALDAAAENTEINIIFDAAQKSLRVINEVADADKVKNGRYFEPFFTTKTKGSGLGLAISKKIMDIHGFTIMIERTDPFTVLMLFDKKVLK